MVVNEIGERRGEEKWMDGWHNVMYLCCFALWFWAYGLFSTQKNGYFIG